MIDRYGRNIHYLRLSVTDLCNLRCTYCMPQNGVIKKSHDDILRVEEIEEIVRAAAELGVDKVRITGGEPLIRNGIVEICRRVRAVPQIKALGLTTNGVLLYGMARPLREAGVDRVNISLDTLREDRYSAITRGGEIKDVLRGMEAARREGLLPIKLNVVLIGGFNDDEIADFVDLTRNEEIEVRFIELMPIGQSAGWDACRFVSCQKVLDRVPQLAPQPGPAGVASLYRLPGARGTVGLIRPLSRHFCAACNRIRVTADGKLKPCLHSDREISLKGAAGAQLRRLISQGILEKPMRHHLTDAASECMRNMNQVGG